MDENQSTLTPEEVAYFGAAAMPLTAPEPEHVEKKGCKPKPKAWRYRRKSRRPRRPATKKGASSRIRRFTPNARSKEDQRRNLRRSAASRRS